MLVAKDIFSYNILLTDACPTGCGHCFLRYDTARPGTFSISRVKRLVERIQEITPVPSFNWGGGEPLILGKEYMRELVSLDCFDTANNALCSTFDIDFDDEWKEILSRFSEIVFSLDSYRMKTPGFNLKKMLSVVGALDVKKGVSYTPCVTDTRRELEEYWKISIDAGADVFYVGFLYSDDELLPPELYLRILDWLEELHAKYGGPELGHTNREENVYSGAGWRAYDCFTKGFFVTGRVITSCYILYSCGYSVPYVYTDDFIEGNADIVTMNEDFIGSFFMTDRLKMCHECSFYSMCMGGCPYFVWRSKDGMDVYCSVYKRIFRELV